MKSLLLVILIVIILAYFLIRLIKKELKHVRLYGSSSNPVIQPGNYAVKLVQYAPNIYDPSKGFALFQKQTNYFLVSRNDPGTYIDIKTIYPSFTGKPVGLVVINGSQYQENSFIVFSSNGKVYNPFTISHNWRNDYLYLPNQNPIAVDGRPVDFSGSHGLFNSGNPSTGVLFRFYYSGYYIEEQACLPGDAPDPGNTNIPLSCHNLQIEFPPLPSDAVSYYHIGTDLFALSKDGWIYQLIDQKWTPNTAWISNRNHGGSEFGLFAQLNLPDQKPSTKKNTPILMGADYDHGIPIFLILENGKYYMVDRDARKYDFRATFGNQNVFPDGNIVDITKCGEGEYDFIMLATDGNLYGPTLPGQIKSINDFTQFYPPDSNAVVSSITSSYKWSHKLYSYTLIFLYNDGKWFEIEYDIKKNQIGALGQTDQTSGLWTEWPHLQTVLRNIPCPTCIKLSSNGWSLFVQDSAVPSNNLVYSINNPPESWIQMLYCTPNSDESGFATSTCVGVGRWKDNTIGITGINGPATGSYLGLINYPEYGTDLDSDRVIRKIPLSECLIEGKNANVIMYDQNESDCHIYSKMSYTDTYKDPGKSIFVQSGYNPYFTNRFCVQHNSTGKYLYWDFTDPDNQYLGMNDVCIYNNIPNLADANTGDLINLTKSMGALWSSSGANCLYNLNGSLTGSYLDTTLGLGLECLGGMAYTGGKFTDGTNCLNYDGTNIKYGPCGSNDSSWNITPIPCPSFSSTGYIFNYCS